MTHYDRHLHIRSTSSLLEEEVYKVVSELVSRLTDRRVITCEIDYGLQFCLNGLLTEEKQRELEAAIKAATGFPWMAIHVLPNKVGQTKIGQADAQ